MKDRSFIDTNVLIYTDDNSEPDKQQTALNLIESGWNTGNLVFSTQVMQEYFVASTRKLNVDVITAQQKIRILEEQEIIPIEMKLIHRAIEIQSLYKYSFWDSLIISAAQQSSCKILYSEDMQNHQKIDRLEILNPFAN